MNNSGIYKIQSKIKPNRFYIGSSINTRKRRREHFNDLRANRHSTPKLQRHYNKYGEKDLEFVVIEFCKKNDTLNREQYYLDLFLPYFNSNRRADSRLGVKLSGETKEKIRQAHLGKKRQPLTKEHKRKISESNLGKNKGKKASKETREKMSKMRKGNKYSQGYKWTDEQRKRLSKARMGNKNSLGYRHTEETKRKMSLSHIGNKDSAKINIEHNGRMYYLNELARKFNIERTTLKGRIKRGWSLDDALLKPVRKMNYL